MPIIVLKAWYLRQYEPLRELEQRPYDLRLSKNSLLKTGLRADFLEESETIKQSEWFRRYLDGEVVEFYIEGSGGYAISNIDLSSHEIYFTKQEVMARLDPTIFLSYQTEYAPSSQALQRVLAEFLDTFNRRSRLSLTLETLQRPANSPLRLSSQMMRKIHKCLVFVADTTAIAAVSGETPQLLPSPHVCLEIGYALQSKRTEQILLAKMERNDLSGQFPFDLPTYQQLEFPDPDALAQMLPGVMEILLARFSLIS